MKFRYEAVLNNPEQRDNLCQCIQTLGGKPEVANDIVFVEYEGEKEASMIELFEQFSRHTIRTIR